MKNDFIKHLIKGKIAEIIFEQMFRESEKFTILHSGYEYILPELAQYQHKIEIKAVIENIRNAPDFILITQDKTEVYVVEVKYRSSEDRNELKKIAEDTLNMWNPSWLFVASPAGFFFDPCHTVVNNDGNIHKLSEAWVKKPVQNDYLKLLNEFELVG